jgi:hypothetical protein
MINASPLLWFVLVIGTRGKDNEGRRSKRIGRAVQRQRQGRTGLDLIGLDSATSRKKKWFQI